jgi:hypothetical protein
MRTGKAIKKPIPVEFIELVKTHTGIWQAYKFIHGKPPYDVNNPSAITQDKWWDYCEHLIHDGFMPLKTLESGEGTQNALFGDYILKGIDGECWPIKADIFERTYDTIGGL